MYDEENNTNLPEEPVEEASNVDEVPVENTAPVQEESDQLSVE